MAKGRKPPKPNPPNTVPQVTGLTATVTLNGVFLQWNPLAGATAYWIRRDNVVPAIVNTTNYTDSSVRPGNSYTYSIAAVVNSVLGPNSVSVTVNI